MMTVDHWLALLVLVVQCGLMRLVMRWMRTTQDATQAARDLIVELRLARANLPPDSEMVS